MNKYILLAAIAAIICVLTTSLFGTVSLSTCSSHIQGTTILRESFQGVYQVYNPSIVKIEDKYVGCARLSTLTYKNILYCLYGHFFRDSFFIFFELDSKRNLKLIYPSRNPKALRKAVLEDPRIIKYNDQYVVSSTDLEKRFPVITIWDLNYNFVKLVDYSKSDYYGSLYFPNQMEKNWCPFEHLGRLYVHTDTCPIWRVLEVELDTGKMRKEVEINSSVLFQDEAALYLRCSTSWKVYDDMHYICGLHTKSKRRLAPSFYSVLVLIDRTTLLPVQITDVLCFEPKQHHRIQFLSGLEVEPWHIVLAYGLSDCEVVLRRVPKRKLKFNLI